MSSSKSVMVIMGSTRAGRHCPKITEWVTSVGRELTGLSYHVIDLADWNLPMDDEPGIPAVGKGYQHAHTQAWSEAVAAADAFVFVTPQYNWGYPAPLKNAIDHLYNEWRGKPLAIVTYGGHGGGKCGAQLKQVADGIKMKVVSTMPQLELSDEVIVGGPIEPAEYFKEQLPSIEAAHRELAELLRTQEETLV